MTSFLLGDGVCWGPGSGSVVDNDIEMAARCLRRHQRVLKGAAGRGQRERRRRRNEDRTGERAWVGCAQGAGGSGTGAGRRNWGHASPDRPTRATQATKQPGDPSGPGDDPSHVRVAEVHPGHCRSTRIPSYPQTKHVLCCAWSKTPSLLARPQHLRPSSCVASTAASTRKHARLGLGMRAERHFRAVPCPTRPYDDDVQVASPVALCPPQSYLPPNPQANMISSWIPCAPAVIQQRHFLTQPPFAHFFPRGTSTQRSSRESHTPAPTRPPLASHWRLRPLQSSRNNDIENNCRTHPSHIGCLSLCCCVVIV